MAATDQTYRNQRTLDIVFAVSCILMLLSIIWMFADDYYKSWKTDQKVDRGLQSVKAERDALNELFAGELGNVLEKFHETKDEGERTALKEQFAGLLGNFEKAEAAVASAKKQVEEARDKGEKSVSTLMADKARIDAAYQGIKAEHDSVESLYYIAVDDRDKADAAHRKIYEDDALRKSDALQSLKKRLAEAQIKVDTNKEELKQAQITLTDAEKVLANAEDNLKKLRGNYDRYHKLALLKRWSIGDSIRDFPVIDGFAPAVKIQQVTLDDLTLDYSFKQVTRYDRCTTCHIGIERLNFDKQEVHKLTEVPGPLQAKLNTFRTLLDERKRNKQPLGGFDPDDLPSEVRTISSATLTETRVNEFCGHPRLDLFVDSNSPHTMQKFGCTICHSGQGSATEFVLASHTPNDATQKKGWEKDHGWESIHFWDYPMQPKRFVESSCLKCHHQVTDLIRYGNKQEAPKLLRGYNLVRENGCFGCHDITGVMKGRSVGPDLRLEPSLPLQDMTPDERNKILEDTANPPGTMRKVGPSLFRVSEKTNTNWMQAWLKSPRGFRPDTKMPHFYQLSNNDREVLKGSGQEEFPAAEINAIAHYLFHESENYLKGDNIYRRNNLAMKKQLEEKIQYNEKNGYSSDAEKKELAQVERKLANAPGTAPVPELVRNPVPIKDRILDSEGQVVTLPEAPKADNKDEHLGKGRQLFSERGCLACHLHSAVNTAGQGLPAIPSADFPPERVKYFAEVEERHFGPNLSRLKAKLGKQIAQQPDEDARRWLVQWLLNPNIHSPRTRMPITHLQVEEAADVAYWLLNQNAEGWEMEDSPKPELTTLKNLARVYLEKLTSRQEVDAILEGKGDKADERARQWLDNLRADADERVLSGGINDDNLKSYVGKKAINRLGCFGCHNIPGFETTKPIGTPLNDWGKKDPERIAFEDIGAYVKEHYNIVKKRDDDKDPNTPAADWKEKKEGDAVKKPYEEFFAESVEHHHRDGFLHQKLVEPRSYDYHRDRTWDDRLRMPQFKFSRKIVPADAPEEERALADKEEAEAREAVMTFILGLVADPIPLKYVNNPSLDRLAEVKGRQVLDKFNCAACHLVRSGLYEFRTTPDIVAALEEARKDVLKGKRMPGVEPTSDYDRFKGDNAWEGLLSPSKDRLEIHGVPIAEEGKILTLWFTRAMQFTGQDNKPQNIPAGEQANLPSDALLSQAEPYHGTFTEMMLPYAKASRIPVLAGPTDEAWARAALPPPLLREGEKVQPAWLYNFLRNPGKIRPQQKDDGIMFLRMPKFNMSDDEAMALVNYFGAADRLSNPGDALNYPYMTVDQRGKEYWRARNKAYVEQLEKTLGPAGLEARSKEMQPYWEQLRKDLEKRLAETKEKVSQLKEDLQKAKDPEKKTLNEVLGVLQGYVKTLETQVKASDSSALAQHWRRDEVYGTDAYRLLITGTPCLSCHQVGGIGAIKGPALDLATERLRPDWTLRWLANPRRFSTFIVSPMPPNFPKDNPPFAGFAGTPLDQAQAVRDVMMDYPEVADRPANRYYLTIPGGK